MIDIIDDTDNIDSYSVTFVRDSQSHKSKPQGHKFTTRTKQLTQFGRRYTVTLLYLTAITPGTPRISAYTSYF